MEKTKNQTDIINMLATFYEYNSAGIGMLSKHDNVLSIVIYTQSLIPQDSHPDGSEVEYTHYLNMLDSIVIKLKNIQQPPTRDTLINELILEAIQDPQHMRYRDICSLIILSWTELKKWSITYRLMKDIVLMLSALTREQSKSEIELIIGVMWEKCRGRHWERM